MNPAALYEAVDRPLDAIMRFLEWIVVLLCILACSTTPLAAQRGKLFRVPSGAMTPTLLMGDVAQPDTTVPPDQLQHGAIIVFESPVDSGVRMVQRIVGLPGDTLAMRNDTLYRNGLPQSEPYRGRSEPKTLDPATVAAMRRAQLAIYVGADSSSYAPTVARWGPLCIPEGQLFTLGDDRHAAYDGRFWGTVPFGNVHGTIDTVLMSYDPERKRLRTERRLQRVQ